MAKKTKRNPQVHSGNETTLNSAIDLLRPENGSNVTVLNPQAATGGSIAAGTVLCGSYRVTERLPIVTGEADLYICVKDETRYVAKIYRRSAAIKPEVTEKLMQLRCDYVATVQQLGEYNGFAVEILPYYNRGSLQGRTFSFEQLKECIIPCLNEGLKALHDAGIIHKDLKPANIMITEDQNSVAIIDFGISSVTEEGNTVIVTKTGMTPEYSAPESFKGLFSTHADYYSLGITLYELFCGKTPYGDLPPEDIERYIAIQRIPFPPEMPLALQALIKALTYFDISNRRDKSNPNRRWGYEEVRNWLAGKEQTIPGEGIDRKTIRPYFFAGENYTTRTELARGLASHWEEGKKELFRGKLSDYYSLYDPEAFRICQEAEQEASHVSGQDDLIFWKTLYALMPECTDFFWKGRVYAGLPALGRELLEHLKQNTGARTEYMAQILTMGILSQYVKLKNPDDRNMLEAVQGLENSYCAPRNDTRQKMIVLYLTAYMLSGQKILYAANREFHDLQELSAYMRHLLGENNEHLDRFKKFCHTLVDRYDNLIPALESWLIAIGKRDALNSWKNAMDSL